MPFITGLPAGFEMIRSRDAHEEKHCHGGEDRPTLLLIPRHAAVTCRSAPAGIAKISSISMKFVNGVGTLKRMGAIGVEESAAIGAEFLDDFLRSHRTHRESLLDAFQSRYFDIGRKVLNHSLRDQQ